MNVESYRRRVASLSEASQYVRGYGMRLHYVIQSKDQLRAKYGPDVAEDLFDNPGSKSYSARMI
jgi:type IV secretory pathway TraG/TraD family ATPase VirD4